MLLGFQQENGTTRSDDDDGHRQYATAVARSLPSAYCGRSVTPSSISQCSTASSTIEA